MSINELQVIAKLVDQTRQTTEIIKVLSDTTAVLVSILQTTSIDKNKVKTKLLENANGNTKEFLMYNDILDTLFTNEPNEYFIEGGDNKHFN